MNVVEFAVWLAVPIACLALVSVLRATRGWRGTGSYPAAAFALSVAGAGVMLAIFGKTQGEVARLWLFLVPCLCLLAAQEMARIFGPHKERALVLLLALQAGTVYLMKRFLDFT